MWNRGRGYRRMGNERTHRPQNPMIPLFRYLAEKSYSLGRESEIPRAHVKLLIPYGLSDLEVCLVDYFGEIYDHIIPKCPKVISYQRSETSTWETRQKIKAIVGSCLDVLHSEAQEGESCTELDIIQIVLTMRAESELTDGAVRQTYSISEIENEINSENGSLQAYQLRMSLPDGQEAMLELLRGLGATIESSENEESKIVCNSSFKKFHHRDRWFGTALNLHSSDLSFYTWCVVRTVPDYHVIVNPGPDGIGEEIDMSSQSIGDLRIKPLIKNAQGLEESIDLDLSSRGCPEELKQPDLGGLVKRSEATDGFIVRPDGGILEIKEFYNKVKYCMEMDGFKMSLLFCDGKCYDIDRQTGRSFLKQEMTCWPKLKIFAPSKNSDVNVRSNYIDTVTVIVEEFLNALGDGRLRPQVWYTYVNPRDENGTGIPSTSMQDIRRRIATADTLEAMLDVAAESPDDLLRSKLNNLLSDIEKGSVLLPKSLISKVKNAAQERGL